MNRTEFLRTFGTGAVATCAGCSLVGCSDETTVPPTTPGTIDFTIDISQSAFAPLQNVGGSVVKDSIIIARVSSADFVALAKACTHQGTTVTYQHSNSRFNCSNHGSNFSLTGSVINGPAQRNLKQFNTELVGSNLRIFS